MVIHEAVLSGALAFLRGKVHGFIATQLTTGIRNILTKNKLLLMFYSGLHTIEMFLQT